MLSTTWYYIYINPVLYMYGTSGNDQLSNGCIILQIRPPEKLHFAKDQNRRASESSEQREARLSRRRLADRERDRDIRARESSEQREARLSERRLAYRERARARRGSETATQREVRRRFADRSRRVSQYMYIIILLLKFTHVSNYDNSKALHATCYYLLLPCG